MKGPAQRCFKRFILLLFLAGFSCVAKSQQPYLRNYSVSDGLPSNEIYDIFQDSKGFLWFATDAGASRYDGYRFTNFTLRDGLPDNAIFGFCEDSHGRIWFRSYSGMLSYYDGVKIVAPPVNAELRKILNGQLVLSLYVDAHDTLWLSSGGEGGRPVICVLPGFTTIDKRPLPEKQLVAVRELEPGRFFFSRAPVYKPGQQLFFFPWQGAAQPIAAVSSVSSIFCTRLTGGEVLLGFTDRHFEISGSSVTEVKDAFPNIRYVASKDNTYWSCLASRHGVRLMRGSDKHVLKTFLEGYSVTDCQEDHEGGIWFTTLEKGVFYMPYVDVEMFLPSLATGEKINAMTSFHGRPVVATFLGNLFQPGDTAFEKIPVPASVGYVSCVYACNDALLLCAQSNSPLYNNDLRQPALTVTDSGGKRLPLYYASFYDAHRFCAMSVRSVHLVDTRTAKTEVVCPLLPERMRCVCRGNGDTLWMGGLSGLWMLAPGKTPVNMAALDPLLGQRIDFLYYDTLQNRLWMSSKGVGLLMKKGNNVQTFDDCGPAMAATCRALSADAEGNIWVATNAGAFCVSETNGKCSVREFSIRNGLSSNDIVGIVRSGDTVWMASSDRILRFRLSAYPYNRHAPPLFMQQVRVDGHVIDAMHDGRFSPAQNTIAFSFTGLSYKSFGQVRYRFRLIGEDTTWKETQANEVTFYSLPPGTYRFSVYALNNDGIGPSSPVEFSFVILPPFWQEWWFIVPVTLLLLTTITLLFRFRIRRVRQKEIFNRRLIEMEMTALRAQMNPHFIFNAINSIHNFVLTGDRTASTTFLAKFSKLIRNVLENSGQKQIPLAKELDTLLLYIEIERMRFSDGFTFTIDKDPSLDLSRVMVVPLLLQPYVENAIWHGLLHKKGARHLRISIEDAGEMLRCLVDDNGIGRERAAEYKSQRNTVNNSMGGEISLRRLNLLNSLHGAKFSLNYTDKKAPDGTPLGTRVELLIPKVNKTENS